MISNIGNGLIKNDVDEDFIEDNIIYFQKLIEISIERLIDKQRKNLSPIHQILRNIEDIIKGSYIKRISGRLKFKLKDCHDVLRQKIRRR